MLKIHDIKSIVEIPDFTIYIYYSLIITIILFFIFIIYLIYKSFKSKTQSKEKKYFIILQNIDFSNTKESSYLISKYGRLLASNEREKKLIDGIHYSLEQYKYKKNIKQSISADIKNQFSIFMDSLDVK
jgi:ABC-type glycerol-3-phosphate transport system permease component